MAYQAKIRMMPSTPLGGGAALITTRPQKTSATFELGDPVKIASGNVVACTGSANKGTGSTLTLGVKASSVNLMTGIAGVDAASGAVSDCPVFRFAPGARFIGNIVHGTAASAVMTTADISDNVVFIAKQTSSDTHYGWTKDVGSGISALKLTLVRGRVTKLIDPASTVNGRVEVEIIAGGVFEGLV